MLEMSWKWKLTDKRTQERYVEKGLVEESKVQESLNTLPDLAAQAVCVEIAMEDCQMESDGSSASSLEGGQLT